MRIIESLQRYFGGRTHQPVRVDHSAAPTPKLRAADNDARLATAVLKFREFTSYIEGLPEGDKLAILAAGNGQIGDACKVPKFVEFMEQRRQMYMGPTKLLQASSRLAAGGNVDAAALFLDMARQEAAHDKAVVQLKPIALKAKPGPTHTFKALCELWGKRPDGTWRVKSPRSFTSTAEKLAGVLPRTGLSNPRL